MTFWQRLSGRKSASPAAGPSHAPTAGPKALPKAQHSKDASPIRVRIPRVHIPSALVDIRLKLSRSKFYEAGIVTNKIQILIAKITDVVTLYGKTHASLQMYTDYCKSLKAKGSLDDCIFDTNEVYEIVASLVVKLDKRTGNITALEEMRAETRDHIQQCLQWGFVMDAMEIIDPEGLCSRSQVSFQSVPHYDTSVAVPRCEKLNIEESSDAIYWPTSLLDTDIHVRSLARSHAHSLDGATRQEKPAIYSLGPQRAAL
jgi:hypothetical protein